MDKRETGEVDVYGANNGGETTLLKSAPDWIVVDGTGKNCAGIIAALSEQITSNDKSIVEVIIPDVLNTYDLIMWAEKNNHSILTQKKDPEGSLRMLIQP